MSYGEFLIYLIIGLLVGHLMLKRKQQPKETNNTADIKLESSGDYLVDIEYIPEHNTYYAYETNTGKFITQDSNPDAIGTKLGKAMPQRYSKLVVANVKSVGRFKEANES